MRNISSRISISHICNIKGTGRGSDFSTMFISLSKAVKKPNLLKIENESQINTLFKEKSSSKLKNVAKTYFDNKGETLYLLQFPFEMNSYTYKDFRDLIFRVCDSLSDLEVISFIDLFSKENEQDKEQLSLLRIVQEYCKIRHLMLLIDLPQEFSKETLDEIGESIICHPWIINKDKIATQPSIYVSALMSSLAREEKLSASFANKELTNAIDISRVLTAEEMAFCEENRINPIKFIPHKGVRVWGTKVFNSFVDTTTELRILKLIKRRVYKIARLFVFESHTKALTTSLISAIDSFLLELWEKGYLAGNSSSEAYSIVSDDSIENGVRISIEVALKKPLEFIKIELNRVIQDGTQETLSVA